MHLQGLHSREHAPLPCCATERDYFDDDDELFIFVQKDVHGKTYKELIIYLQMQCLQTLTFYNTLQRMRGVRWMPFKI